MRLAVLFAACLGLIGFGGDALAQEKRVALVIGNDAYKSLPKLANASNDARAMDRKLKELGFETLLRVNASRTDMGRAISEFGRKIASPDTVGLVFYAGHGIQAFERNWLIPIDAALDSDDDLQTEAIDTSRLHVAMDEARNPLNIVILDACRDNPLPKRQRSAERGLAVIAIAPRGSIVAYSASPNQKSQDGSPGGNGIYTGELLKALDEPGLKIEDVFKRANGGVQRATGGRQVPWFNASIQGDFFFRPGAPSPIAPAPVDPAAIELSFWESVKASTDAADFEAYLKQYPKGRFADLARNRIRALKAPAQTGSVTTPPPSRDPQARPAVGTYDPQPGQVFRDCADCPEMVVIPAGSFVMGVAPGEEEREGVPDQFKGRSVPQHSVNVRSFMLGKYEVTVGEFARFVNETGHRTDGGCFAWNGTKWDMDQSKNWRNPGFGQGDRHPVACVSWDDAKAYTTWLSRRTGKSYRLASEAEWEYAARAGTSTARHWGNDGNQGCGFANTADQTAKSQVPGASNWAAATCNDGHAYTAPVGSFWTNGFGLHDMIGNVWEWTEDCWNENYNSAPTDGSAWQYGKCEIRVRRGGSWIFDPWNARSAYRSRNPTVNRYDYVGFRVARTY